MMNFSGTCNLLVSFSDFQNLVGIAVVFILLLECFRVNILVPILNSI